MADGWKCPRPEPTSDPARSDPNQTPPVIDNSVAQLRQFFELLDRWDREMATARGAEEWNDRDKY